MPAVVFGLFFDRGWKNGGTVPGAVDNLAACALVMAMEPLLNVLKVALEWVGSAGEDSE